ncbi:MAG: hypothetical protein F6K23_34260 [Okeania sp. SIO2C9]|uniref:hypothetical protein n=1 Tax=Okeania sp. SIO2C9 TaxID=2607791 RepID=UPI0013BEBF14|nr:hypothetical protein [Okeania sp. SIO2C9]NEQ77635.1 hypothetical protein [Okeania sp. SIO2C9]
MANQSVSKKICSKIREDRESRKNCSRDFSVPEYFRNEMLPHWQTRTSQTKICSKIWQDTESSRKIVRETFLFRNTFGTRCYPIGKSEHLKQKSAQKFGKTQKVGIIVL